MFNIILLYHGLSINKLDLVLVDNNINIVRTPPHAPPLPSFDGILRLQIEYGVSPPLGFLAGQWGYCADLDDWLRLIISLTGWVARSPRLRIGAFIRAYAIVRL